MTDLSIRALSAVRMVGTGIIAAFGQLVVDMPAGYFGALEQTTEVGRWYALGMMVGTGACAAGALLGRRAARWVYPPLALVGMAFFLPALGTDLVVAGTIILWQLGILSRILFAELPSQRRRHLWMGTDASWRPAVVHLLALSVFSTTLVAGFQLTEQASGRYACLFLASIAIVSGAVGLRDSRGLRNWLILGGVAIAIVLLTGQGVWALLIVLGVLQLGLLAIALVRGPLVSELVRQFVERPALLVVSTFAAVAVLGAVALSFPAAAEQGRIAPIDALFTAVSATCVTGLIVVDTPTAYSTLGEAIVLLLFQVGGLGIMVLSTFGTVILGGRLTLRGERALEHVLDLTTPAGAYRLVRFIVLATLGLEALGASVLTFCYLRHGFEPGEALWRGIFQAVSAFCNAGFSLQTDSIVIFQEDALALLVHAVLIILGGLGFFVLAWLWSRIIRRSRARAPVQVKVVMLLSGLLIAGGMIVYAGLEWEHSLAGLSTPHKLLNAFFQSVTTRTAGFNSVDFGTLRAPTVLLVIVFMFIGAAPGGTGGGIKVTTVAVLTAAVPEILGARHGATLFRRMIPGPILQRAATIAVVAAGTMVVSLFLLLVTEDDPFVVLAFESVSALGTVGLSLGATAGLSSTGKWIVMIAMFIGRIGPLTLALALGQRPRAPISYPETRIMVG